MNLYVFHRDFFERHYNCSFYTIDAVPLNSRQHVYLGIGLITLFTAFTILYVPCMIVIARHLHQSGSYKMMFFSGLGSGLGDNAGGWASHGYLRNRRGCLLHAPDSNVLHGGVRKQ
jgi:Serpentine type 7TM GPCR chemoreceptor Srt